MGGRTTGGSAGVTSAGQQRAGAGSVGSGDTDRDAAQRRHQMRGRAGVLVQGIARTSCQARKDGITAASGWL